VVAEHVDVLIVGAGISGIGAAVHLQQHCPAKSYVIFERRDEIGGTWSLFRYPGIRSDSDMYTLGFRFKPWTAEKSIAEAPTILNYLRETISQYGLKDSIRFGQHVQNASWSSETGLWTVSGTSNGKPMQITANMLFMCSGYYNYDQGFTPDFPGRADFKGQFVHPQFWPDDLDYRGKKVVVIGSGATAVTLVPAMAQGGAAPAIDRFALAMQRWFPAKAAYSITRWRNVLMQLFTFNIARKRPVQVRNKLIKMVRDELGADYDIATHFTPRYNPWEERLCLVPDSDIFNAIKAGKASLVTDHVETFTKAGIKLKSGAHLDADIIVSATGLNLQVLGGMQVMVDGNPVNFGERVLYKGIMFNDVPNLAMWFGYTNASWTLKADLTSEYMCRVINHMDATGAAIAAPKISDPNMERSKFVDFSSGYFERAKHLLPQQGTRLPWKLHQNYAKDIRLLRHGPVTDDMAFSRPMVIRKEDYPLLEAAE
jgi:monooxygenase